MIRLLLAFILTIPAMARSATIAGRDLAGQNLICGPGSTANNSIPCYPDDVLSGVFTNVGLFQINAGTTVFVTPAIPLIIFASTISIPGTLNGSGRGEVGVNGNPDNTWINGGTENAPVLGNDGRLYHFDGQRVRAFDTNKPAAKVPWTAPFGGSLNASRLGG